MTLKAMQSSWGLFLFVLNRIKQRQFNIFALICVYISVANVASSNTKVSSEIVEFSTLPKGTVALWASYG